MQIFVCVIFLKCDMASEVSKLILIGVFNTIIIFLMTREIKKVSYKSKTRFNQYDIFNLHRFNRRKAINYTLSVDNTKRTQLPEEYKERITRIDK